MSVYILRRILYAVPILAGVNILTFFLFFVINSPDDIARINLGDKHIEQHQIDAWKKERGYDKPTIYNSDAAGLAKFTATIFFNESIRLFVFDFGISDSGRDIAYDIQQRMWPSLVIAIPTLLLGVLLNITFALLIVFFRASYVDFSSIVFCICIDVYLWTFLHYWGAVYFCKITEFSPYFRL